MIVNTMHILWLLFAQSVQSLEGWSQSPSITITHTFEYSARTISNPETTFVFSDKTITIPAVTTTFPATTITTTETTAFLDISNDIADLGNIPQTFYPNIIATTISSYADIKAQADVASVDVHYTRSRPDILREFVEELDSILPDWYGQYYTALNPFQPPESLSSALSVLNSVAPYPGVSELASRYVEAWRTYSAGLAIQEASVLASDLNITPDASWLARATQAAKAVPADTSATTTPVGQTPSGSAVSSSRQPSSAFSSEISLWILSISAMVILLQL